MSKKNGKAAVIANEEVVAKTLVETVVEKVAEAEVAIESVLEDVEEAIEEVVDVVVEKVKDVKDLTRDELVAARKQLTLLSKQRDIIKLKGTAKNHLDKFQDKLFELKEAGVDITEFLNPIEPVRNPTKTNARLAKESEMLKMMKETVAEEAKEVEGVVEEIDETPAV